MIRFYLNRPISGVVYLLTGGLLGIGWLIDICLIPGIVDEENIQYNQMKLVSIWATNILVIIHQLFQSLYHTNSHTPIFIHKQIQDRGIINKYTLIVLSVLTFLNIPLWYKRASRSCCPFVHDASI
jgi:TM2 domain-containing membrane protein YozV